MEDLDDITGRKEQERDRIAELESKVENREERIADLESELETARDVSAAARKMANALAHGDGGPPDSYQATLQTKNEQIEHLASRIEELEERVDGEAADSSSDTDSGGDEAADAVASSERVADGDDRDEAPEVSADVDADAAVDAEASEFSFVDDHENRDALVDAVQDRLRRRGERLQVEDGDGGDGSVGDADSDAPDPETVVDLLQAPPVVTRVNAARRESKCNDDAAWSVVTELATNPGATAHDLAEATGTDVEAVHTLLTELRRRELVLRQDREYAFHVRHLRKLVAEDDPSKPRTELRDQWQQ
jgi:hypothetical protein